MIIHKSNASVLNVGLVKRGFLPEVANWDETSVTEVEVMLPAQISIDRLLPFWYNGLLFSILSTRWDDALVKEKM